MIPGRKQRSTANRNQRYGAPGLAVFSQECMPRSDFFLRGLLINKVEEKPHERTI